MDVAAFSPTALQLSQDLKSDVTNLNQSTSDQLTRSKVCAETWNELTAGGVCGGGQAGCLGRRGLPARSIVAGLFIGG